MVLISKLLGYATLQFQYFPHMYDHMDLFWRARWLKMSPRSTLWLASMF